MSKKKNIFFYLSTGGHVTLIALGVFLSLFLAPPAFEDPIGEITIDLSGGFGAVSKEFDIDKKAIKPALKNEADLTKGNLAEEKQKEIEKERAEQILKQKEEQAQKIKAEKKEALVRQEKIEAEKKKKQAERARQKKIEAQKKAEAERLKKREQEKKNKEEQEKQKKIEAEKKKKEALAKQKKIEAEKKKVADLIAKKQAAAAQKKNDERKKRLADKIKALNKGDKTKVTGKKGDKNASPSKKLGGGVSWNDRNKMQAILENCWERYQTGAKESVTVHFFVSLSGRLKGEVKYISGDKGYGFTAAKRAVQSCHFKHITYDNFHHFSEGIEVVFTPIGVNF